MSDELFAIKSWIYFGFNYGDPRSFIDYICEQTGRNLQDHLYNKFIDICDRIGSYGAMNYFYTELDSDLRNALADYAVNVYGKKSVGR